ncbi:hypothetical protein [Arthrobacter sp. 24S4-2]|uniref:hypothetical protein n=1 Tax=Arthrobacter sp. 24S4-2 TaxID=2575374 RepID=UPI0015863C03|nr:hypothetical protein [Arthrobacter sp. 24S4-2]
MDDLGVAVVVDDEADMRHLLEGILRQAGFSVYSAAGDVRQPGNDLLHEKVHGGCAAL